MTANKLLAIILLTRTSRAAGTYAQGSEMSISEVRYFAQDSTGEWYGYTSNKLSFRNSSTPTIPGTSRTDGEFDDGVWFLDQQGIEDEMVYLGKTELRDDYNTRVYEVET